MVLSPLTRFAAPLAVLPLASGLSQALPQAAPVPEGDTGSAATEEADPFPDYASLSIDELLSVELEVTSVARRSRSVADSAAAVYVLTREDLRRSGATSIPEALRLVPGLQVARLGSSLYAITARGDNDFFANKLLVLMDGRTLYTPLFSGTFWDVQDYPLDDVERIEVIRGPGATMWGANAVNGVINVITRSAHDTHGLSLTGRVGTFENGLAGRFGDLFGETGSYRLYVSAFDRDALQRVDGLSAEDAWSQVRVGARADWDGSGGDRWTVQGDVYAGSVDSVFDLASFTAPPEAPTFTRGDVAGGNLLGRWTRDLEDGGSLSVQGYYDYTYREYPGFLRENRGTFDLDFQHDFMAGEATRWIWGLGYRHSASDLKGSALLDFDDEEDGRSMFSVFAQGEHDLAENLTLTAGSKLEHNDLTGFEFQPTARALWRASGAQTLWAAVSRAVTQPSQAHHDVQLVTGVIPGVGFDSIVTLFGGDTEPEELWAYELGARRVVSEELSLDLALFFNDYDQMITKEPGTPFPDGAGNVIVPVVFDNRGAATSYGAELAAEWAPREDLRIHASYAWLEWDFDLDSGSGDPGLDLEGFDPEQQVRLRGSYDLTTEVTLSALAHWVDRLPFENVDDYLRVDAVAEWLPREGLSLALVAQNLLHDGESEFGSTLLIDQGAEVERAVYLQLRYER